MKRNLLLSVVFCLVFARAGLAQEVIASKLKPADATLTLPFNTAVTVRELLNGRVIFSMPRYKAVADMGTGRIDSIPDLPRNDLVAFAADTSLIRSDGGWVFAKGTTVLGMLEATNPVVVAANALIGADSMGFLIALRAHGVDSSDVIRINRSTADVEWLARIRQSHAPVGSGSVYTYREQVVYTLDGWLGVLRTAPYRVDWRSPAGRWTLGKPVPVPVTKFDARERTAYIAEQTIIFGEFARTSSKTSFPDMIEHSAGSITPLATPDGKMLVYRTPTADFPSTRYDVVNRDGVVERQIVIGPKEEIIGFGAKSVYVRFGRRDRTEVKLERHPWP